MQVFCSHNLICPGSAAVVSTQPRAQANRSGPDGRPRSFFARGAAISVTSAFIACTKKLLSHLWPRQIRGAKPPWISLEGAGVSGGAAGDDFAGALSPDFYLVG